MTDPTVTYSWCRPGNERVPLDDAVLGRKEEVYLALGLHLSDEAAMDDLMDRTRGGVASGSLRKESADEAEEAGCASPGASASKPSRIGSKSPCPQCHTVRNNRIYCYECLLPLPGISLPRLGARLPVNLVLIRHPKEPRSKSSAVHAQVIAGAEQVRTLEVPLAQDVSFDPATTCVVFPGPTAKAVAELGNLSELKTVVVLDSTWSDAGKLSRLPQLDGLPRVQLKSYTTFFWRYQRKPDSHLATIEAIYFFFRELCEASLAARGERYDGRFDNLLAIYCAQFRKIVREERLLRKRKEPPAPEQAEQAAEAAQQAQEAEQAQQAQQAAPAQAQELFYDK